MGELQFDDVLLERFLVVLNRASKAGAVWRRVAQMGRGRVVVDIVGPEGMTRRWLGMVGNRLAVLQRSEAGTRRCPRLVVAREHLVDVTHMPWRYLANPTLLRLEPAESR